MLRDVLRTHHPPKIPFARQLRKNLTRGELALWSNLRGKQFHGLKFRRQVPIGPYIVDFLCVERRLIIEVDGDSHYEPGIPERDTSREKYLRNKDFIIFRCGNREAMEATEYVLEELRERLGLPFA